VSTTEQAVTGTARIGAALFNGDHGRLADEVSRLEAAGLDFIHLDVFDGQFVSDMGFPPRTIAALRPLTRLPFEVHLGVVEPLRVMPALAEAGADLVLVHVEGLKLIYEALFALREHGVRVGLACSLGAPLSQLEPVITLIDAVLLLSRVTGESARGAMFNPLVVPRIRQVRDMAESAGAVVDIQAAGSVKRQHVPELVAAGATSITFGGALYQAADMAHEVASIRRLATSIGTTP
jgi:ribulose-phosphate 3-epimerase